VAEYYQPNFWPNTPDILPKHLQRKDPAMYKLRYALAATLSSSCGIYGPAYELLDHRPFQKGGEEYADSEKYECKTWNLRDPASIRPSIAAINRIRRAHPALQTTRNVEFLPTDNDRVLAYVKATSDGADQVLVCAALDPRRRERFVVTLPEAWVAGGCGARVKDLLSGKRGVWKGRRRALTIDPEKCPVTIWGMGR
jgi:starch synthase (maltosyl-transferring)